jgi:hypothetical protein
MITRRREMVNKHLNMQDDCFKKELIITKKMINSYFDDKMLITYARSGRYRLLRRDFSGARKDYLRTIFYKGVKHPLWRIRAIIGFIFSLFGMDIEKFAALLGRISYKRE